VIEPYGGDAVSPEQAVAVMSTQVPVGESTPSGQNRTPPVAIDVFHKVVSRVDPENESLNVVPATAGADDPIDPVAAITAAHTTSLARYRLAEHLPAGHETACNFDRAFPIRARVR
jgi:hypothetical protein